MLSMGIPGVPSTLPLLFLLDAPAGCYIPLQSDLASRGSGRPRAATGGSGRQWAAVGGSARQWAATSGTQPVYAQFFAEFFFCYFFEK